MVLEMMKGGELFDRIRKKISFTEKEASDITMQVFTLIFINFYKFYKASKMRKLEKILHTIF